MDFTLCRMISIHARTAWVTVVTMRETTLHQASWSPAGIRLPEIVSVAAGGTAVYLLLTNGAPPFTAGIAVIASIGLWMLLTAIGKKYRLEILDEGIKVEHGGSTFVVPYREIKVLRYGYRYVKGRQTAIQTIAGSEPPRHCTSYLFIASSGLPKPLDLALPGYRVADLLDIMMDIEKRCPDAKCDVLPSTFLDG